MANMSQFCFYKKGFCVWVDEVSQGVQDIVAIDVTDEGLSNEPDS